MRNEWLKGVCVGLVLTMGAATASAAPSSSTVTVYDSTQLALNRYVVLKRVGIEDWISAFKIPAHATLQGAQQAVVNAAANIGADGVINMVCFDKTDGVFNPAGFYCYGNAIRLRR